MMSQAIMPESCSRVLLRRQCFILIGAVGFLLLIFYLLTINSSSAMIFRPLGILGNMSGGKTTALNLHRDYDVWPPFTVQLMNHDMFKENCVSGGEFTIAGIPDILNSWARAEGTNCRELYKKFTAIYTIERRYGTVRIPETFVGKVKAWLGNKEELYKELFHQDIIHVLNMYTRETTVFNPLRDKRPVTKPKESEEAYLERITKESAVNCDFCKYKNFTAEHEFGRVESKLCFSASNIFKLDRLHAVITIRDHDPVNWSFEQYIDMMRLTNTWSAISEFGLSRKVTYTSDSGEVHLELG